MGASRLLSWATQRRACVEGREEREVGFWSEARGLKWEGEKARGRDAIFQYRSGK